MLAGANISEGLTYVEDPLPSVVGRRAQFRNT